MISYSGHQMIHLEINGQNHQVLSKPNETLLNVIRDKLGYTGPKAGCENGDCGACTVLIDDKPMKACMLLAVECINKRITTIEGLNETPIQEAFVEHGGFQCGYCTSGFIVNAYAMLEKDPNMTDSEQKKWLDANLCRCTGYEGIKEAVKSAQKKLRT